MVEDGKVASKMTKSKHLSDEEFASLNAKDFYTGCGTSKPIGTFCCKICHDIFDGSEVFFSMPRLRYTCWNLMCGANVCKISELPYRGYMKQRGWELQILALLYYEMV